MIKIFTRSRIRTKMMLLRNADYIHIHLQYSKGPISDLCTQYTRAGFLLYILSMLPFHIVPAHKMLMLSGGTISPLYSA
jgi:hypothetical protein